MRSVKFHTTHCVHCVCQALHQCTAQYRILTTRALAPALDLHGDRRVLRGYSYSMYRHTAFTAHRTASETREMHILCNGHCFRNSFRGDETVVCAQVSREQ